METKQSINFTPKWIRKYLYREVDPKILMVAIEKNPPMIIAGYSLEITYWCEELKFCGQNCGGWAVETISTTEEWNRAVKDILDDLKKPKWDEQLKKRKDPREPLKPPRRYARIEIKLM